MNKIKDIHKSPAFTILVIIFTCVGIISSIQYSKYNNNNYFFIESFENTSEITEKINPNIHNDIVIINLDISSLENYEYPMGAVPVKVVLGKIQKIKNPYFPRLHLAFLEQDNRFNILIDHKVSFK